MGTNLTISTHSAATPTTTILPASMCFLLDLPTNVSECSNNSSDDDEAAKCILCTTQSRFITGERLDDYYYSCGHIISLILGMLTIIIGFCGTLASILIITVLKRRNSERSFDILLGALAWIDMFCSVTAAICSASIMIWFQNYSRNTVTMLVYYFALMAVLFAKSASSFMTVAITLERFLLIAFPVATRSWFSPLKTKLLVGLVPIFTTFLAFTRTSSAYPGRNTMQGIPTISKFDYIIYSSPLRELWCNEDLVGIFHSLEVFLPLPILLIFNGIIFCYIRKFHEKQKELTNIQLKKGLQGGETLIAVVVVLFICNILPIMNHFSLTQENTIYREGTMGLLLCVAINSAAKLPIYYWKQEGFRKEAKNVKILLGLWGGCCWWRWMTKKEEQDGISQTGGSLDIKQPVARGDGKMCTTTTTTGWVWGNHHDESTRSGIANSLDNVC